MRTTLNIDDAALKAALAADPGKTKTAVINDALRDYAQKDLDRIVESGLLDVRAWA